VQRKWKFVVVDMLYSKNPANGNVGGIDHPRLWTLLFGCFYFMIHGI
jgi:hypothetical protein